MHKNNDHRIAHQLIDKYHDSDTSLCIVVKDSKEARLINNELSLYLNSENINYFPENEILPYDHFSAPDNILSDRFSILNSLDKEKKIIIATIKSLFGAALVIISTLIIFRREIYKKKTISSKTLND